jgi:hypothetical protein
MSHSSISSIRNKFGGRRAFAFTWAKLGVAVLTGAGLAYAPTLGFSQDNAELMTGNVQELPIQEADLVLKDGAIVAVLPDDLQTALNGPFPIVKVVDPANEPDKYGAENYASPGSVSYKSEGASTEANFDISTSGENVNVTITIPKDYLLQFDDAGDPVEVISAGVVIKAGKSSCIWDCYWSNGVKICECVRV